VKRDIYFVQRRCAEQNFFLFFKQSAVGGDYDLKSQSLRYLKKSFEKRMAKRLAHKVKIKVIGIRAQFFRKKRELIFVKAFGRARRSGAK
jgi:hypothetical protein